MIKVKDPSQPWKILIMLITLAYIVWRVETIVELLSYPQACGVKCGIMVLLKGR